MREEIGVNCCHANQDKFWVRDPDGVEWEVYYLNYDLDNKPDRVSSRADRTAGLVLARTSGCCAPSAGAAEATTDHAGGPDRGRP